MAVQEPLFTIFQNMKDSSGSSIKTINHLHAETHSGKAYKLSSINPASTGGSISYVQINGAEGIEGHLKEVAISLTDGLAVVKLIELSTSSTHTTGSAAIPIYNKNRISSNTSNLEFFSDPTDISSTASGNLVIDQFIVGSDVGTNQSASGDAFIAAEDEWIIGNSTYIISIEITTTSASIHQAASLIWYEED